MDSKKLRIAENALRQIAEREGTTVDAVREEIRTAIAMGRNDPSPAAQAFWQSFPCEGREPTPEEVILRLAEDARWRTNGGNYKPGS